MFVAMHALTTQNDKSFGLPLGLEAPVMTPNAVIFSFLFFGMTSCSVF